MQNDPIKSCYPLRGFKMIQQEMFNRIIVQLNGENNSPQNLIFNSSLSDEQLNQLSQYINANPNTLMFSSLVLHVDTAMVQNINFQYLLEVLQKTSILKLNLVFPIDNLETSAGEIAAVLNEFVTVRVTYPVIICEQVSTIIKPCKNKELTVFNAAVIARVQQHNQARLFGTASHPIMNPQITAQNRVVASNSLNKKIKLKALIQRKALDPENLDRYIKLEIQHTEVEEQQQIQEEIIDVAVLEQEQEQRPFNGQLVDFALFNNEPYRSRVGSDELLDAFKYELFGNMPHAIKFLSHEAAIKIAEQAGTFVALNADNLPQNFMLKRTHRGEMVLDYNSDADERKTNAFTPKEIRHYDASELIYDHDDLPVSFKIIAAKYLNDTSSKQLDNLWVRYGDAGVHLLFERIGELGALSSLMIRQYLKRFPHWDRLLDDQKFLDSLKKIMQYEQAELTCLSEFLAHMDETTQFNLADILKGFDAFWAEWSHLANKNKVNLNDLNGSWSHKKVGNPLVYMERLATILRNSRDLSEQLACLKDIHLVLLSAPIETTIPELEKVLQSRPCLFMDFSDVVLLQKGNDYFLHGNKADGTGWGLTQLDTKIVEAENLLFPVLKTDYDMRQWKYNRCEQPFNSHFSKLYQHIAEKGAHTQSSSQLLDNYGAYYASKYEGFYIVSKEMGFHYEPDKQNALTFHPDASLYRVDLEQLIDNSTSELKSRFQGLRGDKILHEKLIEKAYRFIGQQRKGISVPTYVRGLKATFRNYLGFPDLSNSILTTLFFVAHARYNGEVEVSELLYAIDRMVSHKQVIIENNLSLMKLFRQDIRLSDSEGYAISQRIGMLNSAETDHFDKERYIKKLFDHLQANKYGTLKAIQQFAKTPDSKLPFVYALDTTEYFMKNARIASHYHTDLMLFSTLINSKYKEVYFVGRSDECASRINQNMAEVSTFLLKAATAPQPNNFDYFIKALIQSSQYFTFSQFLAASQEIEQLEAFDAKRAEDILAKHQFKLQPALPEIFLRDSHEVKGTIIHLLLALEMSEGWEINLAPVADASDAEIAYVNHKIEAFENLKAERDRRQRILKSTKCFDAIEKTISKIDADITQLEKELAGISLSDLIANKTRLQAQRDKYQLMFQKSYQFSQLTIKELQDSLNQTWKTKGLLISFAAKNLMHAVLLKLRDFVIHNELTALGESAFMSQLETKIYALASFQDADDFEKIDRIAKEAATLANQFKQITRCNYFLTNEQALTQIFSTINYADYDYDTLFALLDILVSMSERDYAEGLSTYIRVSNPYTTLEKVALISDIRRLQQCNLPSNYIAKLLAVSPEIKGFELWPQFMEQIIAMFQRDEADLLLRWMMTSDKLDNASILPISCLTLNITTHREAVYCLLVMMSSTEQPILVSWLPIISRYSDEIANAIIEILAITFTATPVALLIKDPIDYIQLTSILGELSFDNLDDLCMKLSKSSIAITCLNHGLKNRNPTQSFTDFIKEFEKAPFGKRDFSAQFDIEHVERVVNSLINLNHQSVYSYPYRKQMMEAFLFVNRAGIDLPVYYNKPAKDLSNDEIGQLFREIKAGEFEHLNPFQTRLYALGLMREAMYRTTGQFPYSTQMIALIDSMIHETDVITNIDTGQGKSMIDSMKATLLWLHSGRVDLPTAALVDAKRDLGIYGSFWSLLGVPFAKTPISSTSAFDAYEKHGINVGTMAQFALFYSKAKGEQFDLKSEQVSLVMNESDYTILDDRTVYRYAATGGPGLIGVGKDWVYDAINQFVKKPDFKADISSEAEDIAALKEHLLNQAKLQKKSSKFIEKFSDKKFLMLLESAIIVNYRLKENFDYVLTEKSEPRLVNGVVRQTRSAKIIMKDGKVSMDTQYGNSIQQLLYSKLNKIHGEDSFVIEPESKTIISSNNKNMIDYYRSQNGFIWGSSGTVGFGGEIALQYQKYGFEFSKIEPHQPNITKVNKPIISSDESAQFKHILHLLQPQLSSNTNRAPALVIFKDIETAIRFHSQLKEQYPAEAMQLYTGLGNEEQTIQAAAQSAMITVTTPALGRNTDIHYDKSLGMTVIQTFVASARDDCQKVGRTGRQGSKGNVFYSLNQCDLGDKTIEELRARLEEKAETERLFNEELYNILGRLLQHVGQANKAFFKEQWSEFSEQLELKYRSKKSYETYHRDEFLQDVLLQFNALSDKTLCLEQLKKSIDEAYEIKESETRDQKNIAVADCMSPEIFAYHFVYPIPSENLSLNFKEEVKVKLLTLFSAVNTKTYSALNNDYIAYLNMSGATKAVIKEAHQEFLFEYLNAQVAESRNTPFYKRWLGFEGHLNKVVGDSNYLLLFKAMVNVGGEDTMNIDIRSSVVTMLEEYIQYSWFISATKRATAIALINKIKTADTIDDIVDSLSNGIIEVMRKDFEINQHSFWRTIKPVNVYGDSRLQNTLDRSLRLASTIAAKNIDDKLIVEISEICQGNDNDTGNAKVALKSRESAEKHNLLNKSVGGMKGRKHKADDDRDRSRLRCLL